jgi:hypothetical protein
MDHDASTDLPEKSLAEYRVEARRYVQRGDQAANQPMILYQNRRHAHRTTFDRWNQRNQDRTCRYPASNQTPFEGTRTPTSSGHSYTSRENAKQFLCR